MNAKQILIRSTRAALALLVFSTALWAAPARANEDAVGTLTEAVGTVRLLRGENYLETQRGVEVFPQDIVETGVNGSAQIDLKDGSVLKLGPGSRLALTDYKLDKNRNVVSATVDVLTGWLRFAVSKLRKDDSKYRINAPSLTIGIRGTEGVVEADSKEGGVHLVSGRIEVGGQDAQGKPLPPVQVNAGEYIQRLQGQQNFRRLAAPPSTFQNRVPPVMVRKLAVLPLKPGERPVLKPRIVRQITPAEAQQIIRRHPHAQEQLQRRFKPLLGPGAPGGERLKPPGPDGTPPGGGLKPLNPGAGIGGQLPVTRFPPSHSPLDVPQKPPLSNPGAMPLRPMPIPGVAPLPPAKLQPLPGTPARTAPPVLPLKSPPPKKPEDPVKDTSPAPEAPPSPPPKSPAALHTSPPRKLIRKLHQP